MILYTKHICSQRFLPGVQLSTEAVVNELTQHLMYIYLLTVSYVFLEIHYIFYILSLNCATHTRRLLIKLNGKLNLIHH